MKHYGLPTFPIQHGMTLGNREPDELEWLLDHGTIQSDLYRYRKIYKISSDEYRLVRVLDDRVVTAEKFEADAPTLGLLLKLARLDIKFWYWYGNLDT